jgi:ferric-dicitrate binding protein FerR (iron transport regulator)
MEEKNYIRKIIEQYLSDRYERQTEEKVQQWLIDGKHEEEKNQHVEAFWNSLPESTGIKTKDSLTRLKARLGMETTHSNRSWLRIAAVLLPFILLAGSYLLWRNMPDNLINITVPYGETKEIRLPDASTAVLNSGSSIQYPASFDNSVRRIKLSGEAWFSVTKDTSKPFIVETEHLSIEVLGTEFNVKDHPREVRATATLNRGKIKLETDNKQSHILTPNRQLSYDSKLKQTDIAEVNADDFSGWKEGHLIFENMSLPEIIPVVERKFNVSITIDKPVDSGIRYSMKFIRNESLQKVMEILGITCNFSYRITANK